PTWKEYYQKPILKDPPPPKYDCRRIPKEFKIDGVLDEPFWDMLPRMSRFVIAADGKETKFDTIAKCGWNDDGLLVGVWLEEPAPVTRERRNDEPLGDREHNIELFLDPDGDACRYLEIEMNRFNRTYQVLGNWP